MESDGEAALNFYEAETALERQRSTRELRKAQSSLSLSSGRRVYIVRTWISNVKFSSCTAGCRKD